MEFLRSQQQRARWRKPESNLSINELVVLVEENHPPMTWKLGRVIKTYSGEDGLVRVAKIKTASGEYKRGISKICRLPIDVETPESFQGGQNVGANV